MASHQKNHHRALSLQELADFVGGDLRLGSQASPRDIITGWVPFSQAALHPMPRAAAFIAQRQQIALAAELKVGVVLVHEHVPHASCSQIITPHPYLAFARCTQLFYQPPPATAPRQDPAGYWHEEEVQVHPTATLFPQVYLAHGAQIGAGVTLYPGCYIGAHTTIGAHTILQPQVTILHQCSLGERCLLHPGVTVGADGFGFVAAPDGSSTIKIYHLGGVHIGDEVEIGCSSNISRGTLDDTHIHKGAKIDAQVQVAHNVTIGAHTRICAQAGLAGSSSTGDHVVLGPRSCLTNKAHVSEHIRIGALSAVSKSLKQKGDYFGIPAIPLSRWKRHHAILQRLIKRAYKNRCISSSGSPK